MDGYPYFTIFKGDSLRITGIEDTNGVSLTGHNEAIFGTWALDSNISWEFTESSLIFKIYSLPVDSFSAKYDSSMIVLNDSTSLKACYGYRIVDSVLQLFLLKCDISHGDSVCELESFEFVRDDSIGVELGPNSGDYINVLDISPNPFKAAMSICISSNLAHGSISVYDVNGKVVFSKKDISDREINWSPKNLNAGLYVVKCSLGRKAYIKKVILLK